MTIAADASTAAAAPASLPAAPEFLTLTPVDAATRLPLDHRESSRLRQPLPIRLLRGNLLFAVLVLLPTLLAIVYYGMIAADQYASEARFIVRNVGASGTALQSALGNPLAATSRAQDETHSVNEYMLSRDAARTLSEKHGLKQVFARAEGDFINRFPNLFTRDNFERFYRHYLHAVDVSIQGESGISVLEVRAFRPDDAHAIALALLDRAEELVNKLNLRARADAVRFGQEVVRRAEERLAQVHARMTEFRNREMIVDPGKQSQATLDLVARLTGDVAVEKAQLEQITVMTPDSPQIDSLRGRIRAMEQQINQQRLLVTGGSESMAQKLSEFEQITLERELAVKALSSAFVSLENSRQEAQRQQLYLERVVDPHVSDYPAYPRRLLSIALVFGLALCCFLIVRGLRNGILGHAS